MDDRGNDDRSPTIGQSPASASFRSTASGLRSSALGSSTVTAVLLAITSSLTVADSQATHSPTGSLTNLSKRHSNNLFGSGRFKDQNYIRSVARKKTSDRSLRSTAEGQQHRGDGSSENGSQGGSAISRSRSLNSSKPALQEESEEDAVGPLSIGQALSPSDYERDPSPIHHHPLVGELPPVMPLSPRSPPQSPVKPSGPRPLSPFSARAKSPISAAQIRRASLALEEVIRNFEEDVDAEEEILTPRTPNGGFPPNGGRTAMSPRLAARSVSTTNHLYVRAASNLSILGASFDKRTPC